MVGNSRNAYLIPKFLAELKPPSRESVIAKFQPALTTKGDAARGQIVFTQRCMACHRAGTLGLLVGPDLVTVKTKGREGIFTAILEPNKEIAAQFIAYIVNTKDGQTLTGIPGIERLREKFPAMKLWPFEVPLARLENEAIEGVRVLVAEVLASLNPSRPEAAEIRDEAPKRFRPSSVFG
mgnify:CR=1 FL=1